MATTLLVWCGRDVSTIPTSSTLILMPTGHKRCESIFKELRYSIAKSIMIPSGDISFAFNFDGVAWKTWEGLGIIQG